MYLAMHIYIEDKAFLVNFHAHVAWIPLVSVFCSSGAVSGIRGKQMTPAVASERSIFSKNHDWNSYNYRVFRVAVNNAPIFLGVDARGGRKLYTNRHTHTHVGQPQ